MSPTMGPPQLLQDVPQLPAPPPRSEPEPHYGRPCFICDEMGIYRLGDCQHREPEIRAYAQAQARAFTEALRPMVTE